MTGHMYASDGPQKTFHDASAVFNVRFLSDVVGGSGVRAYPVSLREPQQPNEGRRDKNF